MEEQAIVTIKRLTMRGGDSKIVITFGDQSVTIQPNKSQRYDITTLLTDGPCESIQLPGSTKQK